MIANAVRTGSRRETSGGTSTPSSSRTSCTGSCSPTTTRSGCCGPAAPSSARGAPSRGCSTTRAYEAPGRSGRAFAILGRVAPGLAATWALDLFFTPARPARVRGARSAFLAAARPLRGERRRPAGRRLVVGRRARRLSRARLGGRRRAARRLRPAAARRRVPRGDLRRARPRRSAGRRSSIIHFADALRAGGREGRQPHAVIAHSLGAAAAVRAFTQGLEARRAVFVGPTGGPRDWSERFRRELGVPAARDGRDARALGALAGRELGRVRHPGPRADPDRAAARLPRSGRRRGALERRRGHRRGLAGSAPGDDRGPRPPAHPERRAGGGATRSRS